MTSERKATNAETMDCGGFFEQIDDFLDVPNDDIGEATEAASLPPMDLDLFPLAAPFPCSDSVFRNLDISAELSVPYEDIVQLEWLSSFVEDSFSCGGSSLTLDEPPKGSPTRELSDRWFRMSSPVSMLDSSSSSSLCSVEKTSVVAVATSRCGRARSKRLRPKTVNFRQITAPPLPPLAVACARSNNSDKSCLVITIPKELNPERKQKKKKKKKSKKIKFTVPAATGADGDHAPPSQPIRKCLHCEITRTPQWRAGPMGPKTLCNACGVRYKSGRLFPEYRPAASPTFIPTVHSSSHKKVLEMRNNVNGRVANGAIAPIPNAWVVVDRV